MPNAKLRNYLQLHFIVFIWGFTAVLGKLITLDALPLVWYRMLMATGLIMLFVFFKRYSLAVDRKTLLILLVAGFVIMLHWVTFFRAIKVSNVSIALATMSVGAFFTALLEPIWYKRKMVWYEIVFGVIVILCLYMIFNVSTNYLEGILLAMLSALLSSIFSLINGKLTRTEKPSVISLYELGSGVLFLSFYLGANNRFDGDFFQVSGGDMAYIFLLASICTAYAFIASVKVMKYITPYTVMLTINLEPVYGIVLAFFILGESEKMDPLFYVGGCVIMATVLANGILKNRGRLKNRGVG
tara:strand:- start:9124 stop:10020 length:897 start_codon:yes stop_codon:yes gene_type:complete